MKTVVKYICEDGKEFIDKKEAARYEAELKLAALFDEQLEHIQEDSKYGELILLIQSMPKTVAELLFDIIHPDIEENVDERVKGKRRSLKQQFQDILNYVEEN